MTSAKIAALPDRGVVAVTGADAGKFLDSIITNDMELLETQGAIFAGLLTPQGKILFDFFVVKAADGFLLEVARDQVAGLVKRLAMYKLRAKVTIADASVDYVVLAFWGRHAESVGETRATVSFVDPRMPDLGHRILAEAAFATYIAKATNGFDHSPADYHAHRIPLGVPEGGKDYGFGEAFPHEANMDQLSGVSFTKGCYVGQEIVARMEYRGTARRRIVRVSGPAPLPVAGTEVLAGEVVIGAMGSSSGETGLAMLRIDRVAEFTAKGVGLTAGGVAIVANAENVARLMPKLPEPVAFGS
jgi:tRNA-modifying protein YgfZ